MTRKALIYQQPIEMIYMYFISTIYSNEKKNGGQKMHTIKIL